MTTADAVGSSFPLPRNGLGSVTGAVESPLLPNISETASIDPILLLPGLVDRSDAGESSVDVFSSNDPQNGDTVQHAAMLLRTIRYLDEGYIEPKEVGPDGLYADEYDARSTYFYTVNGNKVATGRQIMCDKGDGIMSLPTFDHFNIDVEQLKEAASVEALTDINPKKTVEISALSSLYFKGERAAQGNEDMDAVVSLYSTMLRNSLERGDELWVFNTYPRLRNQLSRLVGKDNLHDIGEPRMHIGSVTTPMALQPLKVIRTILGSDERKYALQKAHFVKLFDGIDSHNIPKDIRQLLTANNVQTTQPNKLKEFATRPSTVAAALLGAYCTARAVPVSQIPEFHGNIETFWGIDVATAWPYVRGLVEMQRGRTATRRALGALAATSSFAAPYAYLYATGQHYPGYVNAAVGGFGALALIQEAFKIDRKSNREERLHSALTTIDPE